MKLPNLKQVFTGIKKPEKKGIFDYEIYIINAFEYRCIYSFSLQNNMIKRILKFSLKSVGKSINPDKIKENERVPFHPAYKNYLDKYIVGLFNELKSTLSREGDSLILKTYDVKETFFTYSKDLKEWSVEINTTGLYEKK